MNRYLIDTNVVSETSKSKPHASVLAWFDSVPMHSQFVSAMTIGELCYGIERCENSLQRTNLIRWMKQTVLPWFRTHIIAADTKIAERWGILTAQHPKTLAMVDSLIAATALAHDMIVVTRDEKHFRAIRHLKIFNPWNAVSKTL